MLRLLCPCQVVPAGGSSTIYISFTPPVLSPDTPQKVECTSYALGFMSLDNEVSALAWGGSQGRGGTLRVQSRGHHSGQRLIGLPRWKERFPRGGVACRTLMWDP